MKLWKLFYVFFRIGLFTFGGGYAMLPMLKRDVVHKQNWATEEELMDYFAISQMTPGIIAVNVATFIGLKIRGMWGGIIATTGVVAPSWIVISLIASFLRFFESNPIMEKAFLGIRIVVVALILHTVIEMGKKVVKNLFDVTLMLCGFLLISTKLLSSIYVILLGVIIGTIRHLWKERAKNGTA